MAWKQCIYCGRQFTARPQTKYCNDNFGRCRTAHWRLRLRAEQLQIPLDDQLLGKVYDSDVLTALAEGKIEIRRQTNE